jgi:hypothetical protein
MRFSIWTILCFDARCSLVLLDTDEARRDALQTFKAINKSKLYAGEIDVNPETQEYAYA